MRKKQNKHKLQAADEVIQYNNQRLTVDKALDMAEKAYQNADKVTAKKLCFVILEQKPRCHRALYLNCVIAFSEQHKEDALTSLQQALTLAPNSALYQATYGRMLRIAKKYTEAEIALQRAIALKPHFAMALDSLAYLYYCQKKYKKAIDYYQRALALNPYDESILTNLALAYYDNDEPKQALRQYLKLLTINANNIKALTNLGVIYRAQGQIEEAIACYERALNIEPDVPNTLNNLGNALQETRDYEKSLQCYKKAVQLQPDYIDALNSCGWTLCCMGQQEEALVYYDKVFALQADHQQTHWNRALTWLSMGNFEQGWPEYEWRWQKVDFPDRPSYPDKTLWNATDIGDKTLLIIGEQGFGDVIQFSRYFKMIKPLVGKIVVQCRPQLVNLLKMNPYCDVVVSRDEALPEFDYYYPLLSLPMLMKTTVETIPKNIPTFVVDEKSIRHQTLQIEPDNCFKIGICWGGSPTNRKLRYRSCNVEQFLLFEQVPNVQLYSLQKGPQENDINYLPQSTIINLAENIEDFADTAHYMQQLDMLISIDTGVAHLAGALDLPAWVMLPYPADWRWFSEEDSTVWYPNMRLFRQNKGEDWRHVIQRVYNQLLTTVV